LKPCWQARRSPSRLLKKAHPPFGGTRALARLALAAAYLQYAWTHLRWVPRRQRAALRLGFLSSLSKKRVFRQRAKKRSARGVKRGRRSLWRVGVRKRCRFRTESGEEKK